MKKYTTSIVYDHRQRTADGKEGPLEVRITYDRNRYYFSTGIRVRRSDWAGSVINRADAEALNERLGFIINKVIAEITNMQKSGEAFDAAVLKDRVFAGEKKEEKDALLKWLAHEVPLLKMKESTRKRYVCMMKRLEEYKIISAWSDLTVENLYKFDFWLHQRTKAPSNGDLQAGRDPVKIGDGAVYNYHRSLHALLTRAVKFGLIDVNPYDRVRGEFRRGIKENVDYLTEEEIDAIESLHPIEGTQVAMARDLFVFQLYTGLSYSDTQAFDIKDYKLVKGKWVSVGERIKTGVPYVSQLLPQAVEVLQRYNMQTPKIVNQQYNMSLKVIQQALGLHTKLHSHLARHTFATRMLAAGAKIENVSKMLGHTNITQTQKYAKVLAQNVHDDFDMFSEKLKNKSR